MKKLLLIGLALVFAAGTYAQSPLTKPAKSDIFYIPEHNVKFPAKKVKSRAGDIIGWYDWLNAYATNLGGATTQTALYLTNDSNAVIVYKDANTGAIKQYNNTWCSAGQVFDPVANTVFANDALTTWGKYVVDSIAFFYSYKRNVDSIYSVTLKKNLPVIDTMIVQWYVLNNQTDVYWWQTTPPDFFGSVQYNRAQGIAVTPAAYTMRIPLTGADTTGGKAKIVPTGKVSLKARGRFAATVTFHPGQKIALGDTMVVPSDGSVPAPKKKCNTFLIETFVDGSNTDLDTLNYGLNNGLLIDKINRFKDRLSGYVSRYTPSSYYVSRLYPRFEFHIDWTNAGIDQASMQNGYGVSDVYPNPTNGQGTLGLVLPKAENVNITMYNMLGQPVKNVASGNYLSGNHQINFSTESMAAGVYFLNVQAGSYTKTVKFSVGN